MLDYKMKFEEETGVSLSKEQEDLLKFWIEGVYIDASYVAAGIMSKLSKGKVCKRISAISGSTF